MMFTRQENTARVAQLRGAAASDRERAACSATDVERDYWHGQASEADAIADEIQAGVDALDRAEGRGT